MSGDLLRHLQNQAALDDQADAEVRGSHGLPLHMHTLGEVVEASLAGSESNRLGMNLALAVEAYRRRLAAFSIPDAKADQLIFQGRASVEKVQPLMESPIESALSPWLIFGDFRETLEPVPVVLPDEDTPPHGDLFLVPQLVFGRYRLDFGIVSRTRNRSMIVAVECDGAAFHDRRKDLRRDAYLAGFRIPTVRATGSEIRTDPRPIVGKVVALVQTWRSLSP